MLYRANIVIITLYIMLLPLAGCGAEIKSNPCNIRILWNLYKTMTTT